MNEKIAKKVDFRKILDQIWDLVLKRVSKFVIPEFRDNLLVPKITKCGDLLYFLLKYFQMQMIYFKYVHTGGPRISWFLVPKGDHEIRGSRILKPSLVLKSQIGSKIFLKSPFLTIFHEIIRDIFTYSSSYSWKFWSRC